MRSTEQRHPMRSTEQRHLMRSTEQRHPMRSNEQQHPMSSNEQRHAPLRPTTCQLKTSPTKPTTKIPTWQPLSKQGEATSPPYVYAGPPQRCQGWAETMATRPQSLSNCQRPTCSLADTFERPLNMLSALNQTADIYYPVSKIPCRLLPASLFHSADPSLALNSPANQHRSIALNSPANQHRFDVAEPNPLFALPTFLHPRAATFVDAVAASRGYG